MKIGRMEEEGGVGGGVGGEKEARSILQTCIQTGEQTPRTKSTEVKDGLHKQLPFCADRHALHQTRQTPCYSSTYIIIISFPTRVRCILYGCGNTDRYVV